MNMPTPFATQAQATQNTQGNHPFAGGTGAATSDGGITDGTVTAKKPRKPSRRLTITEQDYVLQNYAQKNPATIASELTLQSQGQTGKDGNPIASVTATQVANTVRSARKKVEAKIAAAEEAGDQTTVSALTTLLEERLPKRSFRGAGSTQKKTSTLDSLVDNLFSV